MSIGDAERQVPEMRKAVEELESFFLESEE